VRHKNDVHACWQHYIAKAEEERMSIKVAKSLHDSAGSGDLDAVKVSCALRCCKSKECSGV
jgi:hypothetical protein